MADQHQEESQDSGVSLFSNAESDAADHPAPDVDMAANPHQMLAEVTAKLENLVRNVHRGQTLPPVDNEQLDVLDPSDEQVDISTDHLQKIEGKMMALICELKQASEVGKHDYYKLLRALNFLIVLNITPDIMKSNLNLLDTVRKIRRLVLKPRSAVEIPPGTNRVRASLLQIDAMDDYMDDYDEVLLQHKVYDVRQKADLLLTKIVQQLCAGSVLKEQFYNAMLRDLE